MNRTLIVPMLFSVAAGALLAQETKLPTGPVTVAEDAPVRDTTRCKASDLIGCSLTNSKNETLGEIEDIVLDGQKLRIAYAVVASGGFLGMGEKYLAMPWQLIEVSQRGSANKPRLTLGLDLETIKAAPGFDKDSWPDMASSTWAAEVDAYYASRNERPRAAGAKDFKGSVKDGKNVVDHAPASKGFAHRRLSNLIGMSVVDVQHQPMASVEDLIVDTNFAKVDAALLSFGGVLGMGEASALVPSEALSLDVEKGVFVFVGSSARLAALTLPAGKLPALNSEEWLTSSRDLCAKASKDVIVTDGDVIVADASGVKPARFADSFDASKVETVEGTITTIGTVRVGDLQEERLRLRVTTAEGREVIVYAAPARYEAQAALELRSGTYLEVTGSPVRYGTQTVLVAGSIKVKGKTVKLRDDQGRVTWTKK